MRKVKLPLNTVAYWDELEGLDRLAASSDYISSPNFSWQLHRMNLITVGVPGEIYYTPLGVYIEFILEQYRCRKQGADISVETGDYVIDAGACWGDTALYFAERSKPNGRVFSYEFDSDNLEIMRRNLSLNPNLKDRIQIIERAAWNKSNLKLSVQGKGPGTQVSVRETNTLDAGPLTLSIDDQVKQQKLPKVDFIKMDIEGAELPALRGATQTIKYFKPKLAISVYHNLTDFFEIPEFLDSLECGYHYYLRHFTIHAEETVLFAETNQR